MLARVVAEPKVPGGPVPEHYIGFLYWIDGGGLVNKRDVPSPEYPEVHTQDTGIDAGSGAVYLDDVVIFSNTFKEHLQRLREVRRRL